ncbi:glutamyl-tRNA reductase [Paraferrimonas sp. SM1919]|uniref:glutamyl-tRNA reductase n=1 Tax=Paraferrimonas sp. SM1919 TaxID=2662263 RepID=UPI0013D5E15C|nr:glutamyl-tRNA reductase [Paraferrimonas sp. SM1919]
MSLIAIGINHKTASVDLREKLAFSPDVLKQAHQSLASQSSTGEAVVLSTCNRTEIYSNASSLDQLINWLEEFHGVPRTLIEPCLYGYEDLDAVKHLMRVGCGLDSLVLGEPQILGQLKQAFALAKDCGTMGQTLDRLFQRTFSVAKRVRTETAIGAQAVSVAFAAVSMAKHIFDNLADTQVLLVGAGETIELVARHLAEQGVTNIVVANRTIARAQNMAEEFGAKAVSLEAIPEHLSQADIVISSTASPLPIIGKGMVETALKARRHRPMLLVDIAVPRDIEAEVAELDDAYLYTVDDLQGIVEKNMASRKEAAAQAEEIAQEQAGEFMTWLNSLANLDNIRDYRKYSNQIKDEVLERALNKLNQGASSEQVLIELANKLTNRLIHAPTAALAEASRQGDWHAISKLRSDLGIDQEKG